MLTLIKIARIGNHPTVVYAVDELVAFLLRVDRHLDIAVLSRDAYRAEEKNVLWIGRDQAFSLPCVADSVSDDGISVQVKDFCGIITGTNNRAVLIAVYRYLHALGFDWVRPGDDGDVIPAKLAEKHTVSLSYVPTSRHRGVCIEGAASYLHVKNMLTWLPRVGMNTYFTQFFTPFCFYDRWYSHRGNPLYAATPLSRDEIDALNASVVYEANKRSLQYHAAGHGWTCEPFGVPGTDWVKYEGEISDEYKTYMAEVNGKRELFEGIALNTNICYSNPKARGIMLDAIVGYCEKHPEVTHLHFWLADSWNAHCECDACAKKTPADWYVLMLNELDAKMVEAAVDTRVVFLVYTDLLWEPQVEKIKNPDRFVLMFAPISRSYLKPYADFDQNERYELSPYVRNKVVAPKAVGENVARLNKWKENFSGDSFDFDYHLMWNHVYDPGYTFSAKILHADMCSLPKLGLNGMVSCQMQRVAFPTCLPMYAMAAGLWDATRSFEDVCDSYYHAAFGQYGEWVKTYLAAVSDAFLPQEAVAPEAPSRADRAAHAKALAMAAQKCIFAAYDSASASQKDSFLYLLLHVGHVIRFADFVIACEKDDADGAENALQEMFAYLQSIEPQAESAADIGWMIDTLKRAPRPSRV